MMIRQSLQNIWAAFTASLLRLKALSKKELITLLLDPSVRRILFVPILAQSILFGYGATFNLEEAPYVLYDASQTPDSRALSARLEANRIFKRAAEVPSAQAFTAGGAAGRAPFGKISADGRALVGFWIPEDFAQKLARGETAPVYVAADARNTTTANVAVGYAAAIIEEFNASRQVRSVLELKDRYRYNENGITRWNIMTGLILGLAMIQVMLLAGLAVSREREEGSFDMMLMTPLTPVEILIGKAVPPIVIGVLQSAMIFAVCRWWFDIPFAGSLALLFGVVLLFAASIVGLALMISAWAQTLQQSVVACFILLLPSLVLSGLMTPTAAMPEWMQTITILNPVRYGILVVRMIYFENAGISEIAPYLWPMTLIAAASVPGAVWLFGRKVA